MRVWTLHEPPAEAGLSRDERADRVVVVKDGFAWWGLVFGILWLLFHRLWLATLIYLVVSFALAALVYFVPLDEDWASWLLLLPSIWVALEGNDMRRRKLAWKGFTQAAAVLAKSRVEAEQRFFAEWDSAHPAAPASAPRGPQAPRYGASEPQVLGLFPEPGGRL